MEFSFTSYKNNFLDLYHLKLQQSTSLSMSSLAAGLARSLPVFLSLSSVCCLRLPMLLRWHPAVSSAFSHDDFMWNLAKRACRKRSMDVIYQYYI